MPALANFGTMLRTGIDLGGSKIEIACFGDGNSIVLRERIPTPQGDYLAHRDGGGGPGRKRRSRKSALAVRWVSAYPAPSRAPAA
jgi:hypothetical protein